MDTDTAERTVRSRRMKRTKDRFAGPAPAKGPPEVALPPVKRYVPLSELCRYWNSIPKELRDARVIVYVYRIFPKLDHLQPLTAEELKLIADKKREEPETNIGKFSDPEEWQPDTCIQHCLDKWGAGDYSFMMKDTHPSVKRNFCTGVTDGEGKLHDWNDYPPVLNPRMVVLDYDKNQPYIRWARKNGIRLFGDDSTPATALEEKEDSMAQVAATEAIGTLANTVRQMAEDRDKRPAPAVDTSAKASEKTLDVMASAATKAQEIIGDAMKQAQSLAAKTADPNEHLKNVMAMAETIHGKAGGGAEALAILKDLMLSDRNRALEDLKAAREQGAKEADRTEKFYTLLMGQMTSRMEALEKRITELTTHTANPNPTPVPAPAETPPLEKALDALIKLQGKFDSLMGGKGDDIPWWGRVIQEGLPDVLQAAQNISHNIAVARTQQGVPMQPTQVIDTEAPPAPPIVETPQMQMLKQLHGPMVKALRDGQPGFVFAGLLIEQMGEQAYYFVANMGEHGIFSLLQSYGPLWAELIHPSLGPARVQQFVQEFLIVPKAMEAAEAIRVARAQQRPPRRPQQPPPPPQAQPQTEPAATGGRTVINGKGEPVQTQAPAPKAEPGHPGPTVVKPT